MYHCVVPVPVSSKTSYTKTKRFLTTIYTRERQGYL